MCPAASLELFPLCWSISRGDDPRYISHVQPSFLYWLWWEQTQPAETLVSRLKKWKAQHLQKQSVATKWSFSGGGGGESSGHPCIVRGRRNIPSNTPRVVGKNVLSFSFQSWDFFPPLWLNFEKSLKNVPLCTSVSLRVHGPRVKHVIHQNKINNSRVFLLERGGKKRCLLPTCLWWQ